jgi:dihydrofolate reductase
MKISLIVAMDENRGIGSENKLPWRLPKDLKRFRNLTLGHHVIMGRKTYESIGRPLQCRGNIILTYNQSYQAEGCIIVHTPDEALFLAETYEDDEVFIIGGAEIYSIFLPKADRLYLTIVNAKVNVDTYFPPIDMDDWVEIYCEIITQGNGDEFPTTFKILDRRNHPPI